MTQVVFEESEARERVKRQSEAKRQWLFLGARTIATYPSLTSVPSELFFSRAKISFVGDEVSNIIKESIEIVLQNQQYHQKKVRAAFSLPHSIPRPRLTREMPPPLPAALRPPCTFPTSRATTGEPVEQPGRRKRDEEAHGYEHALQVHRHLRHHAKKWSGVAYGRKLLLG